jgi:hypothetical protein
MSLTNLKDQTVFELYELANTVLPNDDILTMALHHPRITNDPRGSKRQKNRMKLHGRQNN